MVEKVQVQSKNKIKFHYNSWNSRNSGVTDQPDRSTNRIMTQNQRGFLDNKMGQILKNKKFDLQFI